MKNVIVYYAMSMLMTVFFERAVLRYERLHPAIEDQPVRRATYQTGRTAQSY